MRKTFRQSKAPRGRLAGGSLLALFIAGAMGLVGCGGGGGGEPAQPSPPASPAQPPTAQASTVSLNVLGVAASTVSGKVTASDPQGLALSYSVATAPTAGTATVDARTGDFTYTMSGHASRAQDTFTVAVSNGRAAAVNATITVRLASDPLLANQWHIRNTGASAFSTTAPVAGNDMNVAGAWAAGYSGRGIKVAVVDTGLEAAHEDLATNVDLASSFNFLTNGSDPTRAASYVGTDHGTEVAGIIGATAFNGKGGRGVAFNARLRGYNYLRRQSLTTYGDSMGGKPMSADNHVFNLSLGVSAPQLVAPPERDLAIDAQLNALRGGLGAVFVKSAGNEYRAVDADDSEQRCADAKALGVSCGHTAQDPSHGGPTPVVVGAINAEGKRASYSTTGAAIWVAAPGGESGFDSTYFDVSRLINPDTGLKPAIVTAARPSCINRNQAPSVANALVTGNHPQALNCQYTAQMNGTSAAAPNVSGTVAMMLEANPRLSARDVKFILAKTAKRTDPGLANVTTTVAGTTVTLEQGWVKNAADLWFSNAYGFGAVDAAAAVEMARTYTAFLPAPKSSRSYRTTPAAGQAVAPRSATGRGFAATVNETFTTVERVIVTAQFDETPSVGCNQIEVVSPAGTRSILLHAGNGYRQLSLPGTRFLSNAFYGEPVNGRWTFRYFNFCDGRTLLSATEPQSIEFLGR